MIEKIKKNIVIICNNSHKQIIEKTKKIYKLF